MKKGLKVLGFIFAVTMLAGCGNVEQKVTTCNLTQTDNATGYKLVSEYKVYSTGDVVDKVETVETVTSEDEAILDYFEETVNKTYSTQSETYGGYTYKVTNENGKVVSEATIDYSKMDLNKYASDNTAVKNFLNEDNRITVEGVTSIYEALGAVCE